MNNPEYIIIHTAAFKGAADIEVVRQWHFDLGWSDIGYHWYIRRDGTCQKGRDISTVGAHCIHRGMNRKSIGICFEGHGDTQRWTANQWWALVSLWRLYQPTYGLNAHEHMFGHRETGSPKTCPGLLIDCEEVREWLADATTP